MAWDFPTLLQIVSKRCNNFETLKQKDGLGFSNFVANCFETLQQLSLKRFETLKQKDGLGFSNFVANCFETLQQLSLKRFETICNIDKM